MDLAQQAAMIAVQGVPTLLSYGIVAEAPNVGDKVVVEVGTAKRSGWVIDICSVDDATKGFATATKEVDKNQLSLLEVQSQPKQRKLKPILETSPGFSSDLLPLLQWISDYYGFALADVIENAVPTVTHAKQRKFVVLSKALTADECRELISTLEKKAPTQSQVLDYLVANGSSLVTELEIKMPSSRSAIRALEKKGLVEVVDQKLESLSSVAKQKITVPELTDDQTNALQILNANIKANKFSATLLLGVTGSGKTEVYIRAIQQVIALGKTALIIVPEIALTPQLLTNLQNRFDQEIAVLHSQVLASQRWGSWESLLSGETRIAIGARSAIFAPMKNLGLIIVDEEHEGSYKQSDGIRYHGRDVAVMRAKFANCPIVLGSATPSFESLLNVKRGRYQLAEMKNRVTSRPLPAIEVVDLNSIKRKEMVSENISPHLYQALCETISRGEQVIILYNRRGFSSYLQCSSCGDAVVCPSCSVTMTYHRGSNILVCHHCGHRKAAPTYCHCRDEKVARVECDLEGNPIVDAETLEKVGALEHRGSGTEKVVDELALLFPTATIGRLDRDSVTERDAYRSILERVRNGETQILVGTQMIAKGHDLPNVTLVGIIDADIGLHLPDFRASERAFQLITQAAGRAGRANLVGRVVLQTREPKHPTIVAAVENRFKAFARFELDFRQGLNYPPWGRMMRIIISSQDRQQTVKFAKLVSSATRQILASLTENQNEQPQILGPAPAAIEKLKDRYRYHMLIKASSAKLLSELAQSLQLWKLSQKTQKQFRLVVDIDPLDML